MILRATLSGVVAPGRVSEDKLVSGEGQGDQEEGDIGPLLKPDLGEKRG